MIRKPSERDFREGAALKTLRLSWQAGGIAVQKVAKGIGLAYFTFLVLVFIATGIATAGIGAIPRLLFLFVFILGVYKIFKMMNLTSKVSKLFDYVNSTQTKQTPLSSASEIASAWPRKTFSYRMSLLIQRSILAILLPGILTSSLLEGAGQLSMPIFVGFGLTTAAALYFVGCGWIERTVLSYDSEGVTIVAWGSKTQFHWLDVHELVLKDLKSDYYIKVYGPSNRYSKSKRLLIRGEWFTGDKSSPLLKDLHADLTKYWKAENERNISALSQQDVFTNVTNVSNNVLAEYYPTNSPQEPKPLASHAITAIRAELVARKQSVLTSTDADTVDQIPLRLASFGRKGV